MDRQKFVLSRRLPPGLSHPEGKPSYNVLKINGLREGFHMAPRRPRLGKYANRLFQRLATRYFRFTPRI